MRYRLDSEDRLVAFDDDWCRFAHENGAPQLAGTGVLGRPLSSFIADSASRALWQRLLGRVRAGRRFSLEVRCDGPENRRLLRLTPTLEPDASISIASEVLSEEARPRLPLGGVTADSGGRFVIGCSWCNRFRVGETEWVEAEELIGRLGLMSLDAPLRISHGICQGCEDRFEATV